MRRGGFTILSPDGCRSTLAEGEGALGLGFCGAGWALMMIALALGLAGCAGLGTPPVPEYDSSATQDLLTALQRTNEDLVAGKWIGKVSVTVDGSRRTFGRAVWAGAEPGWVRFDARTPFGLPVLSLACNESHLTAMVHNQGKYYRKRIGTSSLGQFFPVDISCRDLYRLMTGRPPVIEYHSARLETTTGGLKTIRLSRRFKGTVARLWVDAQSGALTGAELLDTHGNSRYQAWLADSRAVEGFSLPHRLQLESAQGRLDFETARLFPNRPVAPSLFQIRPPE